MYSLKGVWYNKKYYHMKYLYDQVLFCNIILILISIELLFNLINFPIFSARYFVWCKWSSSNKTAVNVFILKAVFRMIGIFRKWHLKGIRRREKRGPFMGCQSASRKTTTSRYSAGLILPSVYVAFLPYVPLVGCFLLLGGEEGVI